MHILTYLQLLQLLQYFRNTLSIVVLKYHDVGHRLVVELHVFHQLQSYELMVAADADIESVVAVYYWAEF